MHFIRSLFALRQTRLAVNLKSLLKTLLIPDVRICEYQISSILDSTKMWWSAHDIQISSRLFINYLEIGNTDHNNENKNKCCIPTRDQTFKLVWNK